MRDKEAEIIIIYGVFKFRGSSEASGPTPPRKPALPADSHRHYSSISAHFPYSEQMLMAIMMNFVFQETGIVLIGKAARRQRRSA